MRRFLIFVLLVLFCTSVFAANKGITTTKKTAASGKQRRLALVIGNSAYKHSGALANPTRDAELIAKTLRDVGFALHGGGAQTDLTRRSLDRVIESFGDSIKPGDVALFYYSGHGLQVAGENYLVPIDANIKKESEVRVKTVPINLLFAKLDGIPRAVNIVVLDACRNNPFARSFRSSSGGLAQMSAPTGTLVAFSTAPGQVAEDGSGNNSTYTEALARYMKEPNLSVENVFKKVRTEVMGATSGVQTPWENTSLTGNFKFIDAAAMEAAFAKQGAAKSAELERLLKMEAEAKAAKEREQAELAKRQAELEKMDSEIAAIKAKIGAGKVSSNDDLKNMVALVKQRESQAKQLETLKAQKEVQERKRQGEIARLKAQEKEKRRIAVESMITDYKTVVNSPYGKDMADAAWQSLIANYPSAEKLKSGDLLSFRQLAIDGVPISKILFSIALKNEKFSFLSGDGLVIKKLTAVFSNGKQVDILCKNNAVFNHSGVSYCIDGNDDEVTVGNGDIMETIILLKNNKTSEMTNVIVEDSLDRYLKYVVGSAMIDNDGDGKFEIIGDERCDQKNDFFETDTCRQSSNSKNLAFYVGQNANEIKSVGFGGLGGNMKSEQVVVVKYRAELEY